VPPSDLHELRAELSLAKGTADDLAVFARLFEALEVPLAIWSLSPGADEFDLIASNQPAAELLGETTGGDFDPPLFTQDGLNDRLRGLLSSPAATALGEFSTIDGLRVFSARGLALGEGVVGVGFFEVTHRRILERERLELVQRMQHAQKLESLGVLAGGIAHDFNNLLAGIMGNTSLALLEMAPTARARPLLERAAATARIASELTRQMLAYSGRGRFVIEPIDLSQLVEEMARLLEVSLTSRAVVRYEMAANLPMVDADASQVRQVVMNLVTNASEAVEGTSGVIRLRTGLVRADDRYLDGYWLADGVVPGDFVFVEVSDTGRGMEEATKARLFDPFFTTKRTGRGLGMAAVLGIVRGHHGAIKVYSELGRGTTIKVLFPVSQGSISSRAAEVAAEPRAPTDALVLVVDDEETVRNIACEVLAYIGCRTLSAGDGQAAVDIFRQQPDEIDLVMVDLTMPIMDGEEAFRIIRSIRPNVPIVLTSGYNRQDSAARFAGRTISGFLQKPWTAKDLIAVVGEALDRGKE
jgi:signal transduction histidine kinase/ActR/RegA family two-component response regulator